MSLPRPARRKMLCLAAVLLLGLLPELAAATVIRPFTTRFETNLNGEIYLTGNVNLHQGSEVSGNNNSYSMQNVDIDGNPATFNSSSADFTLPPGASIVWAGLYWGADTEGSGGTNPPDMNSRDRVLFSAGGGYQTVVSQIPLDTNSGGYRYQGFAEVTGLVRAQPPGSTRTYATANIQAVIGPGESHYAGWGLVLVVRDPAEALRHLHVFDGFVQIDPGTATDTTTVTGFRTPLAGTFDTQVGMIAYEGDLASSGDYFRVNGIDLGDALNPVNNFFNSTISRGGNHITAKNPDFRNQLGFGIDTVEVPYAAGIIANGDTSASLTFAMTGDWYYPGALTFAIDIYDPVLQGNITKSMVDLNGGALYADDLVEFVIRIGNTGNDNAIDVVLSDPIPAGMVFEPGSLQVVSGPNAGPKSDLAGDDQAEYDAGNDRVVFRLGTGADAANGGRIGIDEWTEIRFRARVASDVGAGTTIVNSATVDFIGQISGLPFTATSNLLSVIAELYCDLALTKTVDRALIPEGGTGSYTLTLVNDGPDDATGVQVDDPLPAGVLLQNSVASQGSYNLGAGTWSVGDLPAGGSATLDLEFLVEAGAAGLAQPVANTATAAADQVDTDLADNAATAVFTALAPSDLSTSSKTVLDLNGGDANPGDILEYTVTLQETGGNAATAVTVTDHLPPFVTGFTVTGLPPGATDASLAAGGANGTGFLDVRDIDLPAGGTAAVTFRATIAAAASPGTRIDNTAVIANPGGAGATPAAPTVTVSASDIPVSGEKPLYLEGSGGNPVALSRATSGATGTVDIRRRRSETWTLDVPLQQPLTLDSAASPREVRAVLWLASDRSGDVNLELTCGAITLTGSVDIPDSNDNWFLQTFSLPYSGGPTCAAGEPWVLTVENTTNRTLQVDPSRGGIRSRVILPSATVINVDRIEVFSDSPYPGGTALSSAAPGDTVRIRATISDPFGHADITAARIDLTDPAGTPHAAGAAMTEVAAAGAEKTYEYRFTLPAAAAAGAWTIRVEADEGSEGEISDLALDTLVVVRPLPSITLLKTSSPVSDPVSGTGNPFAIPGALVLYTLTVTNFGSGATDPDSLVIGDVLPEDVDLVLTDPPVSFLDGSSYGAPSSGLGFSYGGPGDPADSLRFATSPVDCRTPGSATYVPAPAGGIDPAVRQLCLDLTGAMNAAAGGLNPEFRVRYQVRIR